MSLSMAGISLCHVLFVELHKENCTNLLTAFSILNTTQQCELSCVSHHVSITSPILTYNRKFVPFDHFPPMTPPISTQLW